MKYKYLTLTGTYTTKVAGFIPVRTTIVIEKVSYSELASKGAELKFKEKTGYNADDNSLLLTPYVETPSNEIPTNKDIINTIDNINISTMKTNELGFNEVVDTAADVLEIARDIVKAGSDGWQLSDAFVLVTNAGKIEEIIRDAPQAIAELRDLTGEEAKLAATALSARLNAEPGTILDKVDQAFNLLSRAYILVKDTIEFAKGLKPTE